MSKLDDLAFNALARSFALRVRDGRVFHGRRELGPLAGASAELQTGGQIDRSITIPRVAAVGILAFLVPKKRDHRRAILFISGEGFVEMVKVDPDHLDHAFRFCVQFNSRARLAALTEGNNASA